MAEDSAPQMQHVISSGTPVAKHDDAGSTGSAHSVISNESVRAEYNLKMAQLKLEQFDQEEKLKSELLEAERRKAAELQRFRLEQDCKEAALMADVESSDGWKSVDLANTALGDAQRPVAVGSSNVKRRICKNRFPDEFNSTSPEMSVQEKVHFLGNVSRPNQTVSPCKNVDNSKSKAETQFSEHLYKLTQAMQQGFSLPRAKPLSFDGDPLNYFSFMKSFENLIEGQAYDFRTKFQQLELACIGDAKRVIKRFTYEEDIETAYYSALNGLKEEFGRHDQVIEAYRKSLTEGRVLKMNDLSALREYASELKTCLAVLKAWKKPNAMDLSEFLTRIFARLPEDLQRMYFAELLASSKRSTFATLVDFACRVARITSDCCVASYMKNAARVSDKIAKNRTRDAIYTAVSSSVDDQLEASDAVPSSTLPECLFCKDYHSIYKCEKFIVEPVESRRNFARVQRLCYNCLKPNHMVGSCPSQSRCRAEGCGARHHTLLHIGHVNRNNQSVPATVHGAGNSIFSSLSVNKNVCYVRLQVAPVRVFLNDMKKSIEVYAFLDHGATRSFCSKSLLDRMNISGSSESCLINGINDSRQYIGHRVNLKVQGIGESTVVRLDNVLALDALPDLRGSLPSNDITAKYPHLSNLKFCNLNADNIDLLIGADVLSRYPPTEYLQGDDNAPTACHTIFGWTLFGPDILHGNSETEEVCDSFSNANCVFHISNPIVNDCDSFSAPMCKVCAHEFADINCDPCLTGLSVNDKRALEIMEKTTTTVDGRLQIGLPWKSDNVKLPNNKRMAETRLRSLKRRFETDNDFFCMYRSKMNEYIENGYAELCPDAFSHTDRTFYICHHAVITSGKFRIVFDGSSVFQGTSLNQNLLSGPDLNNGLLGVLLRFRQEPIAFTGDIKHMFHRVKVSPIDRDSMRFLWFEDGDMTKPVLEYRMSSHFFGCVSSPCVATFAVRKVADDNLSGADFDTVQTLERNMYVDDVLKSCESSEKAISLINQLCELTETKGFHMTKFASNSSEVNSSIPSSELAPSLKCLDLNGSGVHHALGVKWSMGPDELKVCVDIEPKQATRRGILSAVSSIFDPLGLVSPFVLPAKRILQDLSSEDFSWDDTICHSHKVRWENWVSQLPILNDVSVPRCYKPPGFTPIDIQLHCFCDASQDGYGAVAYLRFIDANGSVHVSFVKSVSRITPKRPITVVRLELMSAVVAAELSQSIKRELDYEMCSYYFWTDSMSVLQMINNRSEMFKIFVSNRIALIHSLSKVESWFHVSSELNPADVLSRGVMPKHLPKMSVWFAGPEFLKLDRSHWPKPCSVKCDNNFASEVKVNFVSTSSNEFASVFDLLKRFSCFEKLCQSVGWLLRFKVYMKWKFRSGPRPPVGNLSVDELEFAMHNVMSLVQLDSISPSLLQLGSRVNDSSPPSSSNLKPSTSNSSKLLLKLNPFFDENCHVWRVGGRLKHSNLPYSQRYPIILPQSHHVTELIVHMYHCREGHCGTLHTLSALRGKFWILRGQSEVRRILAKCMVCKLRSAKFSSQWMAPLPKFRIEPGRTPFDKCSVDLFGPLKVKCGRRELKVETLWLYFYMFSHASLSY
ncbi:uncharacterized protein LOC120343863 [Styela clava]